MVLEVGLLSKLELASLLLLFLSESDCVFDSDVEYWRECDNEAEEDTTVDDNGAVTMFECTRWCFNDAVMFFSSGVVDEVEDEDADATDAGMISIKPAD